MPVNAIIRDPRTFRGADVSPTGEQAVAPVQYNDTKFVELAVDDTAYNFYPPKAGHQFVIKGAIAFADKDVSDASDTVIIIYEAGDAATTTVDKTLLQFGMGKLTTLPMLPLDILVNEGKFVNAKTGDDDIHLNILGYYIKAL